MTHPGDGTLAHAALPAAWDGSVGRSEFEDRLQRLEQNIAWLEQKLTDVQAELSAGLDQVFCMASETSLDVRSGKGQIGTRSNLHLRAVP